MQSLKNWPPRSALPQRCRRLLLASFFLGMLLSCSTNQVSVAPPSLPELPPRLVAPLPPLPDLQTLPDGSSTVGMVVEWGRTVRVLYDQAVDRALAVVKFYESLRESQRQSGAVGASTPAAP